MFPLIIRVPSGFQTFHLPPLYVTVFVRFLAEPPSSVMVNCKVVLLPDFTLNSVDLPTIFILIYVPPSTLSSVSPLLIVCEVSSHDSLSLLIPVPVELVESSHDVGEGGILVALTEMCMAGDLGITIDIEKDFPHGFYFGEDQSRYLLEIKEKNYDQIKYVANSYNVFFEKLGIIGGDSIKIKNVGEKKVSELRDNFELGVGAITFNE